METIDFEVLKAAKIRQGELADMLGVSRVSVAKWVKGANIHPLRINKVKKYMDAISSAVEDKRLPLDKTVSTIFRMDVMKRIILEQLKKG